MTMIIDGTNGATFPNSTVQASAGSVIQLVNASTASQISTTSTTFVATSLTATITPKFATSKILIMYSMQVTNTGTGGFNYHNIYRNNTTPLVNSTSGYEVYAGSSGAPYTWIMTGFNYQDSPATTSATTYTVYSRNSGSGSSYNVWGDGSLATIILMEIAA
jgi:hypothetical protein